MALIRMPPVPVQTPFLSLAPSARRKRKQTSVQDSCKDADSERYSGGRKRPRRASAFELDHENCPPGAVVPHHHSQEKKALCVASLKMHLAHTISKADMELSQAKTRRHEVKAKTEAGVKFASRKKPDSGPELQKERQADSPCKVEKVFEFNDNRQVLKELETLVYTQVGPLIVTHPEALEADNNFQRPVEKPGLFLKNDDDLDDSEAEKALRIESLKKRFSHIITKAEQQLLNSERQKLEVKAKIEPVIKVAKVAPRKKPDSESQFHSKRHAARLALQKVQNVSGFNDNIMVMKDLESLGFIEVGVLIVKHKEALKSRYELQRPVEKFGLFLKEENDVDEGADCSALASRGDDLEEGEIR